MNAVESRVLVALVKAGVVHDRIPIDPRFADTAAFCAEYGYPLDHAANTLVVGTRREPRRHAACVVLATTRLDVNHCVRERLGGKVSFADADEMAALTGMQVGGVTPFALPPSLPVLVDARVAALAWVIVGTGGRDAKLRIQPSALTSLPGAQVVEGLAVPRG